MDPGEPEEPRRSGRAKQSTGVWIDGDFVKKSNLYDLDEGERSVWDQELGSSETSAAHLADYDTSAAAPPPPKRAKPEQPRAPKVLSDVESARAACARAVKADRDAAKPRRARFIEQHRDVFVPFGADVSWCAALAETAPPRVVVPHFDSTPAFVQNATMRSYQLEGLRFLAQSYEDGMSAILADEMGLGKTIQTLSFLRYLKHRGVAGPSLVICPLSVLSSWCSEASKFTPDLRIIKLHSADASERDRLKARLKDVASYDVVVTTFEMTKSQTMHTTLAHAVWWRYVVLDEGHMIKNEASDISKAVRKLHFENVLLLTGTPLQNDLHELWALLNFLFPDVFPSSTAFDAAFSRSKGASKEGVAALQAAHDLLQPLMLRRVKAEVERSLPPKLETKIMCPLADAQRWWYKRLLLRQSDLLAKVEASASAAGAAAATGSWKKLQSLMTQLRKCCNHPYLFEGADPNPGNTDETLVEASGKLHVLDRLLAKLLGGGHRAVVFSQFTQTLDLIEDVLRFRGYEFLRLDGSTNRVQRNVNIQAFNAPSSKVFCFLMSTRAGGLGVNLQTADTCILFDSDWNPQADLQAMARVHRIGQTKIVHIYRLVTAGTVEERIVNRAEKKLYLDSMVNRDGEKIRDALDDPVLAEPDGDAAQPGSSELLAALTFGAAAIVNGGDKHNGRTLSDADLDAIIDRSRTADWTSGVIAGGAAHNAHHFESGDQPVSLQTLEGVFIDGKTGDGLEAETAAAAKAAAAETATMADDAEASKTLADLGSEFAALESSKRQRKSRIREEHVVGVGKVQVLVSEYGDGRPEARSTAAVPSAAKRWEAAAAAAALEAIGSRQIAGRDYDHESICMACKEGGELLLCDQCPCSWHPECLKLMNVPLPKKGVTTWGCPHHTCAVCSRKSGAAGGLLFRCMACPNAYCEDHLVESATVVGKCDRFLALGQNHPKSACFILCNESCLEYAVESGDMSADDGGYGGAAAISAAAGLDTTAATPASAAATESRASKRKRAAAAPADDEAAPKTDERRDWDRLSSEVQGNLSVVLAKRRYTVAQSSAHFVRRVGHDRAGTAAAIVQLHAVLFADAAGDAAAPRAPADLAADIAARWAGVANNRSAARTKEVGAALYLRLVRTFEAWRKYELEALQYCLQILHLVPASRHCLLHGKDGIKGSLKAVRAMLALYLVAPRQGSLWFVSLNNAGGRASSKAAASGPPAVLMGGHPAAVIAQAAQRAAAAAAPAPLAGIEGCGYTTIDLAPKALLAKKYPTLAAVTTLHVSAAQYADDALAPAGGAPGAAADLTVLRVKDDTPAVPAAKKPKAPAKPPKKAAEPAKPARAPTRRSTRGSA
ncbi:SNF2 family N-terminal domain-containing protein [Pelagophyceae sp. CCMP2097]|nr:SNF2 family N-terminal domain-containing protein [Pelagophyceae sp. CCMP2097]